MESLSSQNEQQQPNNNSAALTEEQMHAQQQLDILKQIDPNVLTKDGFMILTRQLDQSFNGAGTERYNREAFKLADKLITAFQKTHGAWDIVFDVLNMEGLTVSQYFQAAIILKNKMMFDFCALRETCDQNRVLAMRDNLISLVQSAVTKQNMGRPILNTLCTAIAYLTVHIHQIWSDMFDQMISSFSLSIDHGMCLLCVLKYMADDCDNEKLVIEDSIRSNYFNFIDSHSAQVFNSILNMWSQKLNSEQSMQQEDPLKVSLLKGKIIEAFFCWIKLKLPTEVFETLTERNPDLIKLVFDELNSQDDDNTEMATNCIVELIFIARRDQRFNKILDAVVERVELLQKNLNYVLSEGDTERGEQFTEIFVQLGKSHMSQILCSNQVSNIVNILLKLLEVPDIKCSVQVSFWKQMFKEIGKKEQQEKMQFLGNYEQVIKHLLQLIFKKCTAEDFVFDKLSYLDNSEDDWEEIDQFLNQRRAFGSLLSAICQTCGSLQIYQLLLMHMQESKCYERAQAPDGENLDALSQLEGFLFCVKEITKTLKSNEIGGLKDAITLISTMPQDQRALRIAATDFICVLSRLLGEIGGEQAGQDITKFIQYALEGLNHQVTISSSAECLMYLCQDNSAYLVQYANELVSKVMKADFVQTWRYKKQYTNIMLGFGFLVLEERNKETCQQLIKNIIQPLLIPLNEQTNEFVARFKEEGKLSSRKLNKYAYNMVIDYMGLIGDFFKSVNELNKRENDNPLADIFTNLWPYLETVLRDCSHLDDLIEEAVRLVKHTQRALGDHFATYLVPYLQIAIKGYEQNQISSYVYAVESCLTQFGKNPQYNQIFLEAFNTVINYTNSFLSDPIHLEENPDLVADFFGMCSRFLRYNDQVFYASSQLENLVKLLFLGIKVNSSTAAKTHSAFFMELLKNLRTSLMEVDPDIITKALEYNNSNLIGIAEQNQLSLWKYFVQQGQTLVTEFVILILDIPSRQVIDYKNDMLVSISKQLSPHSFLWFQHALVQVPVNVFTEENKRLLLEGIANIDTDDLRLVRDFELLSTRARSSAKR